jgi:16S rRNA (cytosine1402-N4)-methyltransferase
MAQPSSANQSYHEPVMVEEVIRYLTPAAVGWIIDGTFGGGGHSRALLRSFPHVRVVGVDRDPDALGEAPADDRFVLIRANFKDFGAILGTAGGPERVEGILLDLGVSSHQLDVGSRGFSYHEDGPLDMRMGPDTGQTAAELVNEADVEQLAGILQRYGEERFARRIAAAIVAERPITTTTELARCVANAVPAAARRGKHPARRTFQAIRIAVNDELSNLVAALDSGFAHLAPGGRFVVIAYHSLEDRIVKRTFASLTQGCTCPPELPMCVCGADAVAAAVTRKAVRPSDAEVERNPRARSAVLRCIERIAP